MTDQSGFVKEPRLKGSFTNWDQVPMAEIGDGLWEHVQMVAPGTYEWGLSSLTELNGAFGSLSWLVIG